MANAPYGVRLLVGAAAMFVEETRKLPHTLLMYPMTLASQAAHLVMRFHQNVADLLIKGDETLDSLFPPKEEQPEWATFDEDLGDEIPPAPISESDSQRLTEGRFALYSPNSSQPEDFAATATPVRKTGAAKAATSGTATGAAKAATSGTATGAAKAATSGTAKKARKEDRPRDRRRAGHRSRAGLRRPDAGPAAGAAAVAECRRPRRAAGL